MADLSGQKFDNYRLIRLLGSGAFGSVYLAEHIDDQKMVAIKVLQIDLNQETLKSFLNEARAIFRLKHPHIIPLEDFGVHGNTPFLVTLYASNGTLRQKYPQGTQLTPETILPYIKQIADALQYVHSKRLIHQDIKPQNMLLDANDGILLSDFGLAVLAHREQSLRTQDFLAGTLSYMAPEQFQRKPRPASDQYSLGIVVYEWLCGCRPFQGSEVELFHQHLFVPPPSLRKKMPTISPELEQIVLKALAKDPQDRFGSVQEFATAFERAVSIQQTQQSTLPALPFEHRGINRRSNINKVSTRKPVNSPILPGVGQKQQKEKRKIHWSLPLGLGMIAMLLVWFTGSGVLAWGIRFYNDYRYGNPRTYQIDAVVGHGGDSTAKPSHFIATNYNRQAIVVEFQAGDPQKAVSYVANIFIAGEGGDLAPVTVEFRDVSGDRKVDMLIHIHLPNQNQVSVFVNDGQKFRPSNEKDHINLNLGK